ncbi:NAD-dependent epimerase/dehydratase family protein [Pseudomonas sp. F1_0610]|uniref:NAD-dependent epimerase/dehydratase family protein n=1 Tax=Pseudomonas sp. F1_0610 TaxID=3114284 RepID=UPI0039C2F005
MKYLVSGATSGLGRNAVDYLLAQGQQVVALGRNQQVGEQLQTQGAQFIAIDLSQAPVADIKAIMQGCDIVWHCAAKSSPWGDYSDFYANNVWATECLAKAAGELGITRFVHISTPAIYFCFKHLADIKEDFLSPQFANHYARTKFMAEQSILQLTAIYPHTTFVILRPRGLFGPYDQVILPRVLAQVGKRNGQLPLPAGGKNKLDLTFVLNVVHAMELASHAQVVSGSRYNISNQEPLPLAELLQQLFAQLDKSYRIKNVPYWLAYSLASIAELLGHLRKKEPSLTRYSLGASYFEMTLNADKAKQELGYEPLYTLAQGVEITAQWLNKNG